METQNEYGIFLTRAQPFHKGHIDVVKEILRTHKKALIFIGSANKSGTKRNPLSISIRRSIASKSLYNSLDYKDLARVTLCTLNDWSMEDYDPAVKEWGRFLYYNIVNQIGSKNFDIYYNDDISIIDNWFEPYIRERIQIIQLDRSAIADGVSSTKLREAIIANDENSLSYAFAHLACDIAQYTIMREELIKAENNPKDDFMIK